MDLVFRVSIPNGKGKENYQTLVDFCYKNVMYQSPMGKVKSCKEDSEEAE